MAELIETDFPELFSTHLSEDDQMLLDLWSQGLDCDTISCLSQTHSKDHDSDYETDECDYSYSRGTLDDDLYLSESDTDSDSDSDSDSESDSDSDSDSESSDSDEEEDYVPVRKRKIYPIVRKGRTPRPMRIQLLKRLTLVQMLTEEIYCCEATSSACWKWVKRRAVFRDYM